MTTYTIAYDAEADLMIACAPDGVSLDDRVQDYLHATHDLISEVEYHHGLTLTDELQEGDEVVYCGFHQGNLVDAAGSTCHFAVNRKPAA